MLTPDEELTSLEIFNCHGQVKLEAIGYYLLFNDEANFHGPAFPCNDVLRHMVVTRAAQPRATMNPTSLY